MASANSSKSRLSSIGRGGRLVGTRDLNKTIWIVVEGEKTENIYFNKFRKMADLAATEVKVVNCKRRTSATQIVKRGLSILEQEFPQVDEVWCVFDKEGKKCEQDFKSAMQLASQEVPIGKRLQCAVSNPCFEFWILLHDEKTDKPFNNCREVIGYLQQRMPTYTKSDRREIEKICLCVQKAVSHALWLRGRNVECPSTNVDILINALLSRTLKLE
jgi:hypothetical protein